MKILLVHSDDAFAKTVEEALTQRGHEVVSATIFEVSSQEETIRLFLRDAGYVRGIEVADFGAAILSDSLSAYSCHSLQLLPRLKKRNVIVAGICSDASSARLFEREGADHTFTAVDFVNAVKQFDVTSLGEYRTTEQQAPSSKCPVTRLVQALKNRVSRLTGKK